MDESRTAKAGHHDEAMAIDHGPVNLRISETEEGESVAVVLFELRLQFRGEHGRVFEDMAPRCNRPSAGSH